MKSAMSADDRNFPVDGAPKAEPKEFISSFGTIQHTEMIMGSTADKVSGYANEAAGKIKQGVGKAVGSDKLQVEGGVQELKGEAQVAAGKAKDAVKDGANKLADEINRKL